MQIQIRLRVNKVDEDRKSAQLVRNGFILFDNCTEIKYGKRHEDVALEAFADVTMQIKNNSLFEGRKLPDQPYIHPESSEIFDDIGYMVKSIYSGEDDKSEARFHYNVIEWKDRITKKRYRYVFDTVCFIMNDEGQTLRKIEG